MKRVDNKGFTLVELIATIVLLALVMGIGAYSITAVLDNSRKKDYELLIGNINDAAENYYIECRYDNADDTIDCSKINIGFPLSDLVKYGFLTGNAKRDDGEYYLMNPVDKEDISDCDVRIDYQNGEIIVVVLNQNSTNSCPTSY